MAERDAKGRFIKQETQEPVEEVGPARARRTQVKDVLDQTFVDEIAPHNATLRFREVRYKENEDHEVSEGKVLIIAEFSETGTRKDVVVSDGYSFVPNNTIVDLAEAIGGAEIVVDHFGMSFHGKLTQDELTVFFSNSYGSGRAFTFRPSIQLDEHVIPVFLKMRQVHSGEIKDFEFRLRESLEVARYLRDGQESIEAVLKEPMSEEENEFIFDLLDERNMPKRLVEALRERVDAPEEETKKVRSYADVIVFIVQFVKDSHSQKRYAAGLQNGAEKTIDNILQRSKASALIFKAVKDMKLAKAGGAEMEQSEKTRAKFSGRRV